MVRTESVEESGRQLKMLVMVKEMGSTYGTVEPESSRENTRRNKPATDRPNEAEPRTNPEIIKMIEEFKKQVETGEKKIDANGKKVESYNSRMDQFPGAPPILKGLDSKRRTLNGPLTICLRPGDTEYVMREIHEGTYGNHSSAESLVRKIIRAGYYWIDMEKDTKEFVRKCDEY
uniref:Integrase zinc-binding domain-containing protein n=1 Tax=Nicotiana tabacum TaxID=4097 RepID=A0A1S3X5B1_TOBAC|nr:PREDICTED: uncharacterized protein LOC107761342 [Nicotiana tabacum]